MNVRVRTSTGVRTVPVEPGTTLAQLKHTLGAAALRAGFPPRPVTAPDNQQVSTLFRNGDVLVVTPSTVSSTPAARPSEATPSRPAAATPSRPSAAAPPPLLRSTPRRTMAVRVVPDDNSCLFRSVNAVLARPNTPASVFDLRAEVAAVIAANPYDYTADFLGRPNAEYCVWIQSDNSWGGAIELSILANRFAVELAAFDLKTMRLDRYGEGMGYSTVGFLIYDGIHYNYIAEERRSASDVTLFDVADASSVERARALARKEHDGQKFTDTANFTLKCGQCGARLKGQTGALQHANATGHTQFQEN